MNFKRCQHLSSARGQTDRIRDYGNAKARGTCPIFTVWHTELNQCTERQSYQECLLINNDLENQLEAAEAIITHDASLFCTKVYIFTY